MIPSTTWRRLYRTVDAWFGAEERNAAGRSGLFRVIFCSFYLWHLSRHYAARLSGVPPEHQRRLRLFEWLPADLPPPALSLLESSVVAALVLLLFGFRTRLATVAVLGLGCWLESYHSRVDPERGLVLLTFYIPLFMLLNGARWGDTYSVDAALRARVGTPVDPTDRSGIYALPGRAILVVLSMLFLSAGLFKILGEGTWLEHPGFIANLVLEHNVKSAVYELTLNPGAPLVAGNPLIYTAIRYHVLLFETFFFVALFGPRLRSVVLALALLFHSMGGIWLIVTFTPLLIAYGVFVDWQALREILRVPRLKAFRQIPSAVLVAMVVLLATAAGLLWNTTPALRTVVSLGEALTWRTMWYPVFPIALVWLVSATADLVRSSPRSRPDEI